MCLPQPRGLWQCLCAGPAPCALSVLRGSQSELLPALLPRRRALRLQFLAPALASLHCTPPHGAVLHAARAPSRLKPKDTLADSVGLIRGLAVCPLRLCQLRRGSLCGRGTADLLLSLRPSSQDTQSCSHLPWAGLWPRLSGIAPPGCWDTRVTLPCRGRSLARGSATHCVWGWPPLGRRAAPVLLSHPEGAVSPGCCADPWGARPRGRQPRLSCVAWQSWLGDSTVPSMGPPSPSQQWGYLFGTSCDLLHTEQAPLLGPTLQNFVFC